MPYPAARGRPIGWCRRSVGKETGNMGFKFGSRLDPKAASAKGSDDPAAVEDTPLSRLRAGLGLQPAAPAISASAAVEAKRVEPKISRPAEAPAPEVQQRANPSNEAKPIEV